MAELILLTVERNEFLALHRGAEQGDLMARRALGELWQEHQDKELLCFICDRPIPVEQRPVRSQVLPENQDYARLIVAALCQSCFELPPMLRLARCLKILKRMYSMKTGKCISFSTGNGPKHHPSR